MRTYLAAAVMGLLALGSVGGPLWAQPSTPAPDPQIPIHGTVVSVDKTKFTVVLRYVPAGSQPQTKHVFELANHNDAFTLRPGAVVDGTADTTKATWLLSNLNVESDHAIKGQTSP